MRSRWGVGTWGIDASKCCGRRVSFSFRNHSVNYQKSCLSWFARQSLILPADLLLACGIRGKISAEEHRNLAIEHHLFLLLLFTVHSIPLLILFFFVNRVQVTILLQNALSQRYTSSTALRSRLVLVGLLLHHTRVE